VAGLTQGVFTGNTISRQSLLVPFPEFGALTTQENTGYSWYHSFQFTASKRFAKGYTVQGSYTFQKWMQAVNLLNPSDPRPIEEISDLDAPHRINISSVWSLPFGHGRALLANANGFVNRLVGGWEISGIWSLQSGFPLAWNNSIYYGDPSAIMLPLDQRNPDHWFNIANFETNSARQLQSTQFRTFPLRFATLRGPRQNNLDIAIIKQTRISEGKNLEFRAEALNAANHPYFPNPNLTVTAVQKVDDTGFGQISASTMNNYARRLQLSLRLLF
jgi:hypothetical protein